MPPWEPEPAWPSRLIFAPELGRRAGQPECWAPRGCGAGWAYPGLHRSCGMWPLCPPVPWGRCRAVPLPCGEGGTKEEPGLGRPGSGAEGAVPHTSVEAFRKCRGSLLQIDSQAQKPSEGLWGEEPAQAEGAASAKTACHPWPHCCAFCHSGFLAGQMGTVLGALCIWWLWALVLAQNKHLEDGASFYCSYPNCVFITKQ